MGAGMSTEVALNGKRTVFKSPPSTALLWALRDELNLVGTKFGCGAGICGACTVIVNGQQQRSCQTSLSDVTGKSIRTIEGLSSDIGKVVAAAWIKAAVPQCGYCQPGFVTAATSVIEANPNQSPEEVLSQLTNICRCGTYDAIREAIADALATLKNKRS